MTRMDQIFTFGHDVLAVRTVVSPDCCCVCLFVGSEVVGVGAFRRTDQASNRNSSTTILSTRQDYEYEYLARQGTEAVEPTRIAAVVELSLV